ncbi:MAG: helix-turn-helix domain-containing protein [Lachnospiraceae bacterium]|nr:helix-turn-helix domain-containing protein [Lachnospiraceae bacterium]
MKLLIADDEALIREAIIARLKKGNYQFEEIFQAADGLEAWDIVRKKHPEIIITDVRMEGMTGLSLIQRCRSAGILASVIVISGYAEFEYVQSALHHDACCYLLKPLTQSALFDALQKAMAKHDALTQFTQVQEQNNLLHLSRLLQKGKERPLNLSETNHLNHLLKADADCEFMVGAAHISRYHQSRYFSPENIYSALAEQLSPRLEADFCLVLSATPQDRILLVFAPFLSAKERILTETLTAQITRLNVLGATITLGLSSVSGSIRPELFSQSEQALKFRFLSGNGKVYSIGRPPANAEQSPPKTDWKALENELRCKSPRETADRLCAYIDSFHPLIYNSVYLIQRIYELLIRLGYGPSKKNWDYFTDNAFWSSHENQSEVLLLLKEEISLACLARVSDNSLSVTQQAKAFLLEHYREPVSIEMLAEYFHLNPRYFSTLFKKKEGISPLDYLTQIRMEAAKNLLKDTDIPVSEVSALVGYEDPRYFYKVFKKYTGQTPTNFRS